jgi:hypothetical protein
MRIYGLDCPSVLSGVSGGAAVLAPGNRETPRSAASL